MWPGTKIESTKYPGQKFVVHFVRDGWVYGGRLAGGKWMQVRITLEDLRQMITSNLAVVEDNDRLKHCDDCGRSEGHLVMQAGCPSAPLLEMEYDSDGLLLCVDCREED